MIKSISLKQLFKKDIKTICLSIGGFYTVFGAFAILMVKLQTIMLSNVESSPDESFSNTLKVMAKIKMIADIRIKSNSGVIITIEKKDKTIARMANEKSVSDAAFARLMKNRSSGRSVIFFKEKNSRITICMPINIPNITLLIQTGLL